MDWIPECTWRVEADKGGCAGALISSQKLAAAFSWPAPWLRRSCAECSAPETTVMSSRTSGLNKVISVQHVSKGSEKEVWTDGRIYLFHFPLVNLRSSFAHGMFVFHTLNIFYPRYKIRYLKVGSGKVNQIFLKLIPQMFIDSCLKCFLSFLKLLFFVASACQ